MGTALGGNVLGNWVGRLRISAEVFVRHCAAPSDIVPHQATLKRTNLYKSTFTKYMIQNSELQLPTKVEVQSLTFALIDSY